MFTWHLTSYDIAVHVDSTRPPYIARVGSAASSCTAPAGEVEFFFALGDVGVALALGVETPELQSLSAT